MSEAKLDPDALWDAQCAWTDVYDGPGSEEAAMAAAINAFLDAADAESRARLEVFTATLETFKIELEKLRQAIEGEVPWGVRDDDDDDTGGD